MAQVLGWYATVTLLGWLVWPALFRLLRGLPDRGYSIARAFSLLLITYVYWLLGVTGFIQNSLGGILLAVLVVGGLSIWIYRDHPAHDESLWTWISANWRVIATVEILFVAAFAAWTVIRAYNPDVQFTEKPMELAFLNGVRFSAALPPSDPWLSGYAISYYYFGYVMIALLADLTATATAVAFNLGIALLFALTLIGSYGVVYNLVRSLHPEHRPQSPSADAAITSLLGPLFVGIMGNLEGLFRLIHALNPAFIKPGFWHWIDIIELNDAPIERLWPPNLWRGWWWFRASRVIHDRDAVGLSFGLQPIDEFPFFSFLLGDMHPHVLALPFALVALLLAFNLLAEQEEISGHWRWASFGLYALAFGGLAFLNTWDLPIYWFILVAAMVVKQIRMRSTFDATNLVRPVLRGVGILAVGMIAYLPWYISFGSQAGGILPNAVFPTRLHQLLIMFPMLLIVGWFVADQSLRRRRDADWFTGAIFGLGLLFTLAALTVSISAVALRADPGVQQFAITSAGLAEQVSPDRIASLVPEAIRIITTYRLAHPLTPLVMTMLIIGTIATLLVAHRSDLSDASPPTIATSFAMIMILTGATLVLGPEFVYLRDVFGQRLNTIFKFYYATWILWSLAAAYAVHVLIARRGSAIRILATTLTVLLITSGLIYTIFSIPAKTGNFGQATSQPPTLNGIAYIKQFHPDDYAGIQWLQQNAQPGDIVLEAVGGQYSYFGRVSMATGIPTVLGWAGHERQWRGDRYDELAGTREQDVQEIYGTINMQRAFDLLDQYSVTYIFVGSLERFGGYATPAGLVKFDEYLTVAFEGEGITIYRAEQPLAEPRSEELP